MEAFKKLLIPFKEQAIGLFHVMSYDVTIQPIPCIRKFVVCKDPKVQSTVGGFFFFNPKLTDSVECSMESS